eukprot:gb/GECH01007389.1/.p1 GENE.gb/GECH01007389.1/~~gb/GECH01007389.1/.p1  ORF type:complete len:185 (+),score=38.73 gb/GECH01007389.1/:1-555(+)
MSSAGRDLDHLREHLLQGHTEIKFRNKNNVDADSLVSVLDKNLRQDKTLEVLSLGDSLETDHTRLIMPELENHPSLRILDLSDNKITDCKWIAQFLNSIEGLEELNLRKNTIDDQGVQSLCDVLRKHRGLKKVLLGENQKITNTGAQKLLQAVKENKAGEIGVELRHCNVADMETVSKLEKNLH